MFDASQGKHTAGGWLKQNVAWAPLFGPDKPPEARALGIFLKKRAGQTHGAYKLLMERSTHTRTNRFWVLDMVALRNIADPIDPTTGMRASETKRFLELPPSKALPHWEAAQNRRKKEEREQTRRDKGQDAPVILPDEPTLTVAVVPAEQYETEEVRASDGRVTQKTVTDPRTGAPLKKRAPEATPASVEQQVGVGDDHLPLWVRERRQPTREELRAQHAKTSGGPPVASGRDPTESFIAACVDRNARYRGNNT
jgi:hypothetical protein